MVQIRDVPDKVHRTLKARAARKGMSLSDLIKRELTLAAAQPSVQEWLEQTREASPIPSPRSAARLIRDLRNSE